MSGISDIWTLEPHGTPGSAATLAARGVVAAEIAWANQDAGRLTLTIAAEDVGGADVSAYTYKSRWVLRRDGAVFFRGRVRSVPRRSGAGTVTIELVDAWDDLSRTPYLQAWDVVGADGSIESEVVPRVLLSPPKGRETTASALSKVMTAYNARSSTALTLSASLPTVTLPPIEAANLSCAALIREILNFHPGASAWIEYGATSDRLRIVGRSRAAVQVYEVGARPLADYDLTRRDDLVIDSAHIYYASAATRFAAVEGEEEGDPTTIRATRRLAIFKDVWPAGSAITDESLVVELSAPSIADPPPPPIPQMVSIKTRPLPEEGAFDADVQQWWLDNLGLSSLGLTVDDVRLPETSDEGQPHRLRFAWAVDDPNDPLHEAPSTINPASSPVWRPRSVSDLPRQLTAGTLAEWMRVKAAEVVADATLAIRKSTVDDLPEAARRKVLAMAPREGTVQGVAAYLLDREIRITATTAKTRTYRNYTATGTYNVAADTAASIDEARAEAVVPGLAKAIYEDRATAPWEGSFPLIAQEAGAIRHLGKAINLLHESRPEWATMRAMVQGETLRLTTGETTVRVGPPTHLSPQDRAALWQAARKSRAERAQAAVYAPSPAADESDDALASAGRGGVFPGTVLPIREILHPGGGGGSSARHWDLEVVDAEAGTVRLKNPGMLKRTTALDNTGQIAVADIAATHTAIAGRLLCLVIEPDLTTTLEVVATWTGWPYPYTATETTPPGLWIWTKYYVPLWDFRSTASEEIGAVKINDNLYAERRIEWGNMQLVPVDTQVLSGAVVAAVEAVPCIGARRASS